MSKQLSPAAKARSNLVRFNRRSEDPIYLAREIARDPVEKVRDLIPAKRIVRKLVRFINGHEVLTRGQLAACRMLLAKTLPDLASVTIQQVEPKDVRQMSDQELDAMLLAASSLLEATTDADGDDGHEEAEE